VRKRGVVDEKAVGEKIQKPRGSRQNVKKSGKREGRP